MLWSEKLALQFQKKERKKLALRHLNVEARHALGRPCHDGICGACIRSIRDTPFEPRTRLGSNPLEFGLVA